MDQEDQPTLPAWTASRATELGAPARPSKKRPSLGVRDVQLYLVSESITEVLIYFMIVFSPWAFGTTQPWSIWTMNATGYALGGLLAAKAVIRCLKGYRPARWGEERVGNGGKGNCRAPCALPLGLLTLAILAYCLIGALNASSTFRSEAFGLLSHRHVNWLPHSLDSTRTWSAFWNYLALASAFWAIWDWLPGKTGKEPRREIHPSRQAESKSSFHAVFPTRVRRLLWVLAINGSLLGIEGIIQRLEGSGRLLFLIKPVINPEAEAQFGPYHYRSNAAQYLNLLWPVCLGFWWMLNRQNGGRRGSHHLLLFCIIIMAACPIISTTRAGAFVDLAMLVLATLGLLGSQMLRLRWRSQDGTAALWAALKLLLFTCGALGLGLALGWKSLKPRFSDAQMREGWEMREGMYEKARPMARDYPVFGTGPGTFETAFHMYRISSETYWPAQLHNDWLETLITFGWFGSALIALAGGTVLLRWFVRGGIRASLPFMGLWWLSLAGCLTQARWDFPFQIYSIVFLVIVLCALTARLTRRA